MMYPDAGLRSPGDIDVWVDTDRITLLEYVKTLFPEEEETFKHIKLPVFNGIDVDLHYTPLKFYHPIHNKRLQQWIQENKEEQMTHFVRLPNTDIDVAIPTVQACKHKMPQELKGHVCDKMRPISRERHVSRGHLVRIVHEHKQHTAEQNRKPFPFYERKKPRLDVSAEADFLA